MLYKVPDIWTQDSFNSLPDEDDRFEYKSGLLFDDVISKTKAQDDLEDSLSKEICALVNSFGGTLFIGVKDKSKEIDGCPRIFKGKETTKEWLEKKIPEWFEFRLYSFRVNYVALEDSTQSLLSADRDLIHIDIWDSGFLPHQVKKSGLYYYRESSAARKAPHYYLTFLWSSRSPMMSEKVRKWCVEFLNPAIEFLKKWNLMLKSNSFPITTRQIDNGQTASDVVFFDLAEYLDLFSSRNLAAKQFFFVYPNVESECNSLFEKGTGLTREFKKLCDAIEESKEIEKYAVVVIKQINSQYPNIDIPVEKGELLRNLVGNYHSMLANLDPHIAGPEIGGLIARMAAWRLLDLFTSPIHSSESAIWGFSENISKELAGSQAVNVAVTSVASKMSELATSTENLLRRLDEQRDQLAATHATTYF